MKLRKNWFTKVFGCLAGLTLVCVLAVPASAVTGSMTISDASGERGTAVTFVISVYPDEPLEAMGFNIYYDSEVLEWVGGLWSTPEHGLIEWFDDTGGSWGAMDAQDISGPVCTMTFRIKDDAPIGESEMCCIFKVLNIDGEYTTPYVTSTLTVTGDSGGAGKWVPGDENGDGMGNYRDGLYLFYHYTRGTEQYPITTGIDYNDDWLYDREDGLYLFRHFVRGASRYPLP